jgi:hypothetical protein
MKREIFLAVSIFLLMPVTVSAEKVVLFVMDDIQSYWLEDIQEYVVQAYIDHNIPVTLGVIPGGVGPPFLTKIIE